MECAVVCTDAGGIKEVIRNNTDGFMVPVNDWMQIEKPLTWLLENPAEIKNYGTKARQRVEESFSLKVMVGEIEEVYEGISKRQS
jgi:glycosyltransferase involved in cell wall biosynthesis